MRKRSPFGIFSEWFYVKLEKLDNVVVSTALARNLGEATCSKTKFLV